MLDYLVRHWWVLAVRGAVAVLFGLIAVFWPGITLLVLATLFGAYALVDGIFAAVAAFRAEGGHRMPLVLEAAFGIVFGALALIFLWATVLVLTILIGAWAVITGIFEIIAAVRLRQEVRGEWLYILGGALSVFFGLLVWFYPTAGALAVAFIIGIYAIVFGVVMIALSLRVRKEGQDSGLGPA